jgi:predicted tellurium resistance membrane protein TerC
MATYLANYIQKHLWVVYVGIAFIVLLAIQLIIGGLVDLEILRINEQFKKYF